jgi:hypothetical protein
MFFPWPHKRSKTYIYKTFLVVTDMKCIALVKPNQVIDAVLEHHVPFGFHTSSPKRKYLRTPGTRILESLMPYFSIIESLCALIAPLSAELPRSLYPGFGVRVSL